MSLSKHDLKLIEDAFLKHLEPLHKVMVDVDLRLRFMKAHLEIEMKQNKMNRAYNRLVEVQRLIDESEEVDKSLLVERSNLIKILDQIKTSNHGRQN
jgi:hypothetical protein